MNKRTKFILYNIGILLCAFILNFVGGYIVSKKITYLYIPSAMIYVLIILIIGFTLKNLLFLNEQDKLKTKVRQ